MISIVTINLNNKKGLERTIKSVLAQTCIDEIQYIVIDGKSTDGSVDVIKQYADGIDYWVSEKDKGIYNAMNKALSHLKGTHVLWLNSGDFLASADVIEQVLKHLDDSIIIYGDEILFKRNKAMVSYVNAEYVTESKMLFPEKVDDTYFKTAALPHQSSFIRVDYQKQHPYDENYRIISDWKFFREAVMIDKVKYKHIPVMVSYFELGGISTEQNKLALKGITDYYKSIDK